MPKSRSSLLTRRGLIAAGGALGLVAALTACGGGDSAKDGSGDKGDSAASGPWSFKDDLGKNVTTKSAPKNIVAFSGTAAALYDYGVQVKGVFGPTKAANGEPDVQAGSMDISKVEILGNAWGQFNIEKYASLQPDLLVTNTWDGSYWYVPDESKDKILGLAPAVAIGAGGDVTMDKALARTAELAKSLGADLNARKAVDAKARFEAASAKVREAVKANPGIKVLVGSGDADQFYISTPKTAADLSYFQQLGVEFVTPDKLDEGSTFFESLSWENAGKYAADLVLLDNRSKTLQPEQLTKDKPTWNALPAVKAGQVAPRSAEPVYSYDKCAQILEDLAKAVQNAKKVS
ncbi:ABC transporter substrate-binding protein [Streptomyces sp. NBC_01264]|uniref:ABC transporter substrate-binding protein n=1 Tax=Streptomyces sp. NBC_01264 TaxID=2903804 RepID=UPI00224F50FC|nr:ABC transporter substrate-binding protein [Streptomyces sp. NBC_01264]MCX4778566.1 ABC transporter substrate-binding protein [Streptomyces sp. NBC_01264]